jgi:hypothetical protein
MITPSYKKNIVETFVVEHTAFSNISTKLNQCFDAALYSDTPMSLAIIGESRTGKTTVAEKFYSEHLPYRVAEGLKVPVLKTSAPSVPTIVGLAEHMLFCIGDERFYSGTHAKKTLRLQTLIEAADTKMVMIDEFQHFVDKATDRVIHSAADWLKKLVDDCGVSLVILGLESALSVLDQNEQLRGRFLAPVEMPRFNWRIKAHRLQFIAILKAFESELNTEFDSVQLSNSDMAFRLYVASGGLIGYLWKLLRQVALNATYSGRTEIRISDFDRAYLESIGSGPSPFNAEVKCSATESKVGEAMAIGKHIQTKVESKRKSKRIKPEGSASILRMA